MIIEMLLKIKDSSMDVWKEQSLLQQTYNYKIKKSE